MIEITEQLVNCTCGTCGAVESAALPANVPTREEHSALRQRFNEVTDRLMQARRAIVAMRGYRAKGPGMS